MSVSDIVSRICNNGPCCSPFPCERKAWQEDCVDVEMPKIGIGEECPLQQFHAEKDNRPKEKRFREIVTERDTWRICHKCSHSEVVKGYITTEEAYLDYCLDCPIHQIRENIQECRAEAAMS